MEYMVTPILGKILRNRNMTQTQLSHLTGIPQGTISKFDRNRQHQDTHLVAISRALDLKIEDLFDVEIQYSTDDIFNEMEQKGKSNLNEMLDSEKQSKYEVDFDSNDTELNRNKTGNMFIDIELDK